MYTSTKALFTQCTLKESYFYVRYLYSALFHKDSKCFTKVSMGDFFMAKKGAVTIPIWK